MEREKNLEKLVRKAIKGDANAYWKVIMFYQNYMYRIAFLYMKNEDDALDIVHEAILHGYSSINTLKNPGKFKSWLTKIVINCALDEMRNRKKESVSDDYDKTSANISVKEKSISAEYLDLYRGIDYLREEEKTAVILKYFVGFKIFEIAQIMGYSQSGVKTLLHRSKKKLEKYI